MHRSRGRTPNWVSSAWIHGAPGRVFSADDLRLFIAIAHHVALAIYSQRQTRDLQAQNLLLQRLLTHFSPKVRQRLLDRAGRGRLTLGGERSEVSILFSDIRGFTKMSAGMEPDDVVDMLNHYFAALVEAIFHCEGTVDKFIGDAILAVFGSPMPTRSSTATRCTRRWECRKPSSE